MAFCQSIKPAKKDTTTKSQDLYTAVETKLQNVAKKFMESQKFVKQLLAMSISHITFMLDFFHEDHFRSMSFAGVPIKVLNPERKKTESAKIETLFEWIHGAFDAVEKSYLKSLILGVSTPNNGEDEVVESFTFNFTYSEKGVTMTVGDDGSVVLDHQKTVSEVVRSTINMLNSIIVAISSTHDAQTLDDLSLKMKLTYSEDTPETYQPPNFCHSDTWKFKYSSECAVLELGKVTSPFHGLNLHMHVPKELLFVDSEEQPTSGSKKSATPNSTVEASVISAGALSADTTEAEMESLFSSYGTGSSVKKQASSNSQGGYETSYSPIVPTDFIDYYADLSHSDMSQEATLQQNEAVQPEDENSHDNEFGESPFQNKIEACTPLKEKFMQNVRSPSNASLASYTRCACKYPVMKGPIVQCAVCGLSQHRFCCGFFEEKTKYRCHVCSQSNSDYTACSEEDSTAQLECLYKNALVVCLGVTRVCETTMAEKLRIDNEMSTILFHKLQESGVLTSKKRDTLTKKVDSEVLQTELKSNFQDPHGNKLLMELKKLKAFGGQESSSKPFAPRKFLQEKSGQSRSTRKSSRPLKAIPEKKTF